MTSNETLPAITKLRTRYFIFSYVLDLFFFALTNPTHAHVWVLMVGGVLAAVTIWVSGILLGRFFAYLMNISRRAQSLLSGIVTVVGLYVVGMQSIGQLNMRDAFALLPLVAVFYFYATYPRKIS